MRQSSNPPADALEPLNQELPAEVVFSPSEAQRKVKIAFWARMNDNPLADRGNITPAIVKQLTGSSKVDGWWKEAGFKEWFTNTDEQRQRLEQLFETALDAAQDILINTDPKAQSARVQMVKIIAELAHKMPSRNPGAQQVNPLTAAIQGMDKAQLKVLLEASNGDTLEINANKGTIDV